MRIVSSQILNITRHVFCGIGDTHVQTFFREGLSDFFPALLVFEIRNSFL